MTFEEVKSFCHKVLDNVGHLIILIICICVLSITFNSIVGRAVEHRNERIRLLYKEEFDSMKIFIKQSFQEHLEQHHQGN